MSRKYGHLKTQAKAKNTTPDFVSSSNNWSGLDSGLPIAINLLFMLNIKDLFRKVGCLRLRRGLALGI